jgi:hypothetical protein
MMSFANSTQEKEPQLTLSEERVPSRSLAWKSRLGPSSPLRAFRSKLVPVFLWVILQFERTSKFGIYNQFIG